MTESAPMPMCPMVGMCRSMMDKPFSGLMLVVPGVLLVVFGVAVILEPRILVWLVALALVLMGGAMLMLAGFMRKVGARSGGV